MNSSNFLRSFFHKIKQQSYQMALSKLHKLMERYHQFASHSKKSHAKDIKSSLLDYVDNVVIVDKGEELSDATPNVEKPVSEGGTDNKHVSQSHHNLFPFKEDDKSAGPNPYALNKDQVKELSKYFKARTEGPELHPGIEEKLKESIWLHINASVQSALKGDSGSAKMHVDIANYAFKEIAHYMPEAEYQELTSKINERLDSLKVNT